MKRELLIGIALAATATAVVAGPSELPRDNKAIVPVMESCVPPKWTGFYIGGNLGYVHGNSDSDLDLSGEFLNGDTPPELIRAIMDVGGRGLDADGFLAGGFLGYNLQLNRFLIGLEGNMNFLNLRDSSAIRADSSFDTVRTSFKAHYLMTLGPRIGYTLGRFLPYVTGGLAVAGLDDSQQLIFRAPMLNHDREKGESDEARVGWMVGGGLQYAITCHWSARIEYKYSDFDCSHVRTDEFGPNFIVDHDACVNLHSATIGLAYQF